MQSSKRHPLFAEIEQLLQEVERENEENRTEVVRGNAFGLVLPGPASFFMPKLPGTGKTNPATERQSLEGSDTKRRQMGHNEAMVTDRQMAGEDVAD